MKETKIWEQYKIMTGECSKIHTPDLKASSSNLIRFSQPHALRMQPLHECWIGTEPLLYI